MVLPDITFQLGQGGLSGQLPTEDHISGFLIDQPQPTSWGTNKVRFFRSIEQVEAADILETDPTFGLVHYTCKEFFRLHPQGIFYLVFDESDVTIINNLTGGRVRQWGSFDTITSTVAIQTAMAAFRTGHAPAVFIIGATGITDITSGTQLPDLHVKNSPYVSVLVAGDGGDAGAALASSLGVTYVAALGAALGALSKAKVSDSAAWVGEFNFAVPDGELEQIVFAGGEDYDTMLNADLEDLHEKGYLFFRRFPNYTGSYLNSTFSATDLESDYAYIERNRTIQKAERLVYRALLPWLNSPLKVDPVTGQLDNTTIAFFESLCDKTLRENMSANDELSSNDQNPGFSITIDPDQNVIVTGKLTIALKLVPIGVAREIEVLMSFALSVG